MPNIKYSYVFDEELDRIYECFRDYQLNSGIVYNGLVTNLHFIKGEKFDEENAEFSFSWKNYYEIKMIVSNVKNTPNYRSYMNKIYYIDKLSLIISLIYRFYWDSVDEKTVFILDIDYQDIFFKDLIQTDYNKLDFLKICKNVEKYLNSIIQGLAINNSFLINAPINELWKAISNPEIFFTISGKKLVPVFKEKEVNLNSILEFYDSNDKKLNPTIFNTNEY